MCIANVGAYLQKSGPLPFISRIAPYSPLNLTLIREDIRHSQLKVDFKPVLASKFSITFALIAPHFSSGFDIITKQSDCLTFKVIDKPLWSSIYSDAVSLLIRVEGKEFHDVIGIQVDPGVSRTLNGENYQF